MSRSKDDLGYTENRSRPSMIQKKSKAGESSNDSKYVQNEIENAERKAKTEYGKFYLENATETQF